MSNEAATSLAEAVPASEFTRNFDRYRMLAQGEPVAASRDGQITGYFIRPDEYEEFRRFKTSRRSFATVDLQQPRLPRLRHHAWTRAIFTWMPCLILNNLAT